MHEQLRALGWWNKVLVGGYKALTALAPSAAPALMYLGLDPVAACALSIGAVVAAAQGEAHAEVVGQIDRSLGPDEHEPRELLGRALRQTPEAESMTREIQSSNGELGRTLTPAYAAQRLREAVHVEALSGEQVTQKATRTLGEVVRTEELGAESAVELEEFVDEALRGDEARLSRWSSLDVCDTRAREAFLEEFLTTLSEDEGLREFLGEFEGQTLAQGTLLGDYEIQSRLGRGGFGTVYRARYRPSGGEVALKLLRAPEGAGAARRLHREARNLDRVQSERVVRLRHVGQHEGALFLVMDLVEGHSLRAELLAEGQFDVPRARELVCGLLEGVKEIHGANLVHRDLKPENVMIDAKSGEVRILDLGIATAIHSSTQSLTQGGPLGTPLYMSPEQARGERATEQSDIYAVGTIFYELLAGRHPFSAACGAGPLPLLGAIAHRAPADLAALRPDVPKSLVRVIHRALAKDPRERPVNADDFLQTLKGEAHEARGPVVLEVPRLPAHQRREESLGDTRLRRGIQLFDILAEHANRGRPLGVGYADFWALVNGESSFRAVEGRNWYQSDAGWVLDFCYEITEQRGRIVVRRGDHEIATGMDTYLWNKSTRDRNRSAFEDPRVVYTESEWREVFPDHARRVASKSRLQSLLAELRRRTGRED